MKNDADNMWYMLNHNVPGQVNKALQPLEGARMREEARGYVTPRGEGAARNGQDGGNQMLPAEQLNVRQLAAQQQAMEGQRQAAQVYLRNAQGVQAQAVDPIVARLHNQAVAPRRGNEAQRLGLQANAGGNPLGLQERLHQEARVREEEAQQGRMISDLVAASRQSAAVLGQVGGGGIASHHRPLADGGMDAQRPLTPLRNVGLMEIQAVHERVNRFARVDLPTVLERVRAMEERNVRVEASMKFLEADKPRLGENIINMERQIAHLGAQFARVEETVENRWRARIEAAEKAAKDTRTALASFEERLAQQAQAILGEMNIRDARIKRGAEEDHKRDGNVLDELLHLGTEMNNLRHETEGARKHLEAAIAKVDGRVTHESGFLDRLREHQAETVSTTADNFSKAKTKILDVEDAVGRSARALQTEIDERKLEASGLAEEMKSLGETFESRLEEQDQAVDKKLKRLTSFVRERLEEESTERVDAVEALRADMARRLEEAEMRSETHFKEVAKRLQEEERARQALADSVQSALERSLSEVAKVLRAERAARERHEKRAREETLQALLQIRRMIQDVETTSGKHDKRLERVLRGEITSRFASGERVRQAIVLLTHNLRREAKGTERRLVARADMVERRAELLVAAQQKLHGTQEAMRREQESDLRAGLAEITVDMVVDVEGLRAEIEDRDDNFNVKIGKLECRTLELASADEERSAAQSAALAAARAELEAGAAETAAALRGELAAEAEVRAGLAVALRAEIADEAASGVADREALQAKFHDSNVQE